MDNRIYVSYGQKPAQMVQELLRKINAAAAIPAEARIGLKPNLVVARPSSEGATTSPAQGSNPIPAGSRAQTDRHLGRS